MHHIPEIVTKFLYHLDPAYQPSAIYLDGEKQWSFDWDEDNYKVQVFTKYIPEEDKLLVIVDTNDKFIRLPCDLGNDENLDNLKTALRMIFGDKIA